MPTHQEYYQTPGHIVAAAIALPVADSVAVLLRFLARRRLRQPLKVDDWLMLPATLLTAGLGAALVYSVVKRTLGYPLIPDDLHDDPFKILNEKTNVAGKVQFASVLILPLALGLIKLSVLFFYMRIFTVTATSITYKLLVALNVLVSMWAVGFFLANLFQCRLDTWAMWTTTKDLQMHCPGSMYYSLALGITDFSADLIIICIPIVPVWRLSLQITAKAAATGVFLLGAVAVVASLLRLVVTARLTAGGFDTREDGMLIVSGFIYWGMIECGVAIFAACLPVAQYLVRRGLSTSGTSDQRLKTEPSQEI